MVMRQDGIGFEPSEGPFLFRTPQEAAKEAGRQLAGVATRFADEAGRKFGKEFVVLVENAAALEEVPRGAGGEDVAN